MGRGLKELGRAGRKWGAASRSSAGPGESGRALKELVQQRNDDRAYLISTTSDPARQQLLRDQESFDIALGIDWDSLEGRLNL